MHCPQCGSQQASGKVRFCRACGFFFKDVDKLFAPETQNAKADETHSRQIKTAFNQGLLLMLVSLLLAIILTLLSDAQLIPEIYVKIVTAIFVVAGLVRMFYAYICPVLSIKKAMASRVAV